MPRQLTLKPDEPQRPLHSTLIVARENIPPGLSDADRRVLRANLDLNVDDQSFFFHDCEAVRRVLQRKPNRQLTLC
jgi:hypothetical protein